MTKIIFVALCAVLVALPAAASTLDGYDRAKVADELYTKMHGSAPMTEAQNDPELAEVMKKYIYGDLSQQIKLTDTERQLITIVVLTTNQNYKFLKRAIEGALALDVTPLQVREALYHVAPYIGFPKVFEALDVANEVFAAKGIKLPLEAQGTTTDADRFDKGLAFQVGAYGDAINKMRDATPDYQKHLQDNLSAFCFGDTYTRGTLDYKMREMLTMAAIGTLGTGEPQYKAHVIGTLAAGATNEEVIGVITTMNPYIGFPRTLNALRIANEVFAERSK
ncbi:MAG: carboxymuconolactone decarboxylase family protein [Synergistaceae bacterium]|nr:carboxymuconolactone decarboxylase family protein [Synergistaceae bacterium]MBR0093726.1 carboxymuconolactone decarboxylase family protein [Synergistaceae bacterium]